jgi:hypothetical protein
MTSVPAGMVDVCEFDVLDGRTDRREDDRRVAHRLLDGLYR